MGHGGLLLAFWITCWKVTVCSGTGKHHSHGMHEICGFCSVWTLISINVGWQDLPLTCKERILKMNGIQDCEEMLAWRLENILLPILFTSILFFFCRNFLVLNYTVPFRQENESLVTWHSTAEMFLHWCHLILCNFDPDTNVKTNLKFVFLIMSQHQTERCLGIVLFMPCFSSLLFVFSFVFSLFFSFIGRRWRVLCYVICSLYKACPASCCSSI